MRSSVEKLRWGLLAGGALLLLLLAGILGYSRYQAVQAWQRLLKRSGATLTREANGFTYSQSKGGRTVFTLHAARGVQAKDGKYALHDVALTLYRQPGAPPDHIYGSDFEYDQKTGVARALGEVHMDIQAPNAISQSGKKTEPGLPTGELKKPASLDGKPDEPESIHVRTSGLVYVRNLDVAATDQEVEFRYGGLEGHARGAEFNSGQGILRLLADVHFSGELRGHPVTLVANRADLDRGTNLVTLARPLLRTEEGTAMAASTVLHLRASGLVERAEATGEVRLVRGSQTLTAPKLEAQLREASLLESAHLSGGVVLTDSNPGHPARGQATEVRTRFDAQGSPASIVATGSVQLRIAEQIPGRPSLARSLVAERLEATLTASPDRKGQPTLRCLDASGGAHAWAESLLQPRTPPAAQMPALGPTSAQLQKPAVVQKPAMLRRERTEVAGDLLHVSFTPDMTGRTGVGHEAAGMPERIEGQGHTLLVQSFGDGEQRRSSGDHLSVELAPEPKGVSPTSGTKATLQVVAATQQGHVSLRSEKPRTGSPGVTPPAEVTTASADRAEFKADLHQLRLHGGTRLESSTTKLAAADVVLDTESGDAQASGGVRGTLLRGAADAKSPSPEETHVAAESARFVKDSGKASFFGTDGQPAHLWQGGSQVMAATLVLDREGDTLTARPNASGALVRCVFAGASPETSISMGPGKASAGKAANAAPERVLRLSSPRLDYNGEAREATFTGGVHLEGDLGEARSASAIVFLQRAALMGNSAAAAPGQTGQPSPAARTPAKSLQTTLASSPVLSTSALGGSVEKIVLSGKVRMEQPGRVGTGEQLLYTAASRSFVLTGTPGRPPHVVDQAQGSLTGTSLLFRAGDNTVVVAGSPSSPSQAHTRVRTELNVRGQ